MSELQDNVLDDQNSDYTDLESLLAVANSSEFSVSDGFTQEKQEFEKFNSFFEIVTSNETKNDDNEDEVINEEGESEISGLQIGGEADEKDESEISGLQIGSEADEEGESEISGLQIGSKVEEEGESEISGLQIGSEADDEVELEISDLQIGSEADEDFSESTEVESSLTEEDQLVYDKGYKEALEEFEKAMSLEKGSLKDLTETMFSIRDDFQESLEALIKTKICELHNELLDSEIQDFPTPFLNKIKQVASDIVGEIKDVTLELNHADLELLKGSDAVKSLGFEVTERADLRRGEFRLTSNTTGFQRELSH
ncbi:MAG: FliH/SctL family protein [Paracoccaceae bacterium]|uniref:FliH/SctL family protein n=1 Tax=Candidatus Salinivivens marinus TaxID=3381703 RepID=UPI003883C356|tara:strand:+ start:1353 stop:2291 length:939 start_codon:yes stop_codon:yes gene_type:complete